MTRTWCLLDVAEDIASAYARWVRLSGAAERSPAARAGMERAINARLSWYDVHVDVPVDEEPPSVWAAASLLFRSQRGYSEGAISGEVVSLFRALAEARGALRILAAGDRDPLVARELQVRSPREAHVATKARPAAPAARWSGWLVVVALALLLAAVLCWVIVRYHAQNAADLPAPPDAPAEVAPDPPPTTPAEVAPAPPPEAPAAPDLPPASAAPASAPPPTGSLSLEVLPVATTGVVEYRRGDGDWQVWSASPLQLEVGRWQLQFIEPGGDVTSREILIIEGDNPALTWDFDRERSARPEGFGRSEDLLQDKLGTQ